MDSDLIWALGITIVVEYLILLALWRKEWLKLLGIAVLVNAFTNPLANYFYRMWWYSIRPQPRGHALLPLFVVECTVIIVESFLLTWLMRISWRTGFLFSFIANFITAMISFLM